MVLELCGSPTLTTGRARRTMRQSPHTGPKPSLKGTLVLSPHFDDAALSIGGALAAGIFPQPICIYTVFGVSNYTRNRFHLGSHRVSIVRRREESRYAAALGVSSAFAEFREAGLRIGSDFKSIFRSRSNARPCKPARFDRAIRDIVFDFGPRVLVCPLGIGDHWDHLLVHRAVRKIGAKMDVPVLFYEDLPYAERLGPRGAERSIALLDHPWHSITIPIDLTKKCAGLVYYASQLAEDDVQRVCKYAWDLAKKAHARAPCERLWTASSTRVCGSFL